jgi:hypothetical protein
MPHSINLEEIIRNNPNVDINKLEEWRNLRKAITDSSAPRRRSTGSSPYQGRRAQIVDDAESDPRLVRLSR